MDFTWVIVIIVLVLGVVIGNITLLKYSAKFKFPTHLKTEDGKGQNTNTDDSSKQSTQKKSKGFDDDDDEW